MVESENEPFLELGYKNKENFISELSKQFNVQKEKIEQMFEQFKDDLNELVNAVYIMSEDDSESEIINNLKYS